MNFVFLSLEIKGCQGRCQNGATCKVWTYRVHLIYHRRCPRTVHFICSIFCRTARGVTTASVLRVLWALTVKSRGISVPANPARTAASVTQCWVASCVSAHQSLLDSCVRWGSCCTGHTVLDYCGGSDSFSKILLAFGLVICLSIQTLKLG